jgi:hypothetical protein
LERSPACRYGGEMRGVTALCGASGLFRRIGLVMVALLSGRRGSPLRRRNDVGTAS